MMERIAVALALAAGPQQLTAKERLYQHACYTGVAAAQAALPKVPQEDELMARGFASCDGSLARLRASGELARERDVPEFACGYAVGATFAKYGLGREVEEGALSARARRAMESCREELRRQGIK
jgi:hypothetical protein